MRYLLLLVILILTFSGCSTSDTAGATGVGNPTEVSLVASTGDVTGQGGFEIEARSSTILPVIKDTKRSFIVSSIEILVDTISWEIVPNTLDEEIDSNLNLVGKELMYYGPIVFDAVNSNSAGLEVNLPTAAYRLIRLYIGNKGTKETTITMSGAYENDLGKMVPFSFDMAYNMELRFRKPGKAYYWEQGSSVRLDFLLDLDDWFADVDVLGVLGVAGDSEKELKTKLNVKSIKKRIRKSGVLSIYEK